MNHVRICAAALAFFTLPALGTAQVLAAPNGLPAGYWVGRGNSYGHIYKQGKGHGVTSADSFGRFVMTLYVNKAGHVVGRINFGGGANSYVHGGHGHFTYWSGDNFYATSNSSGGLAFDGIMNYRGTVSISGMTIPMEGVAPGNVVVHFTHLDCGSATGDLAVDARKAQQKAGFNTNVKAPFVLLRLGNAEAPGMSETPSDMNNWMQAMGNLDNDLEIDFAGKTKQQIQAEVNAGLKALDEMDKYKECGGKIPLPAYELAAMKELLADDIGLAQLRIKNMK